MNKRTKFTTSIILVLIGVVIGALVFSQVGKNTAPTLFGKPGESANIVPSKERPISSLRDLNMAFVEIAESVNPAVVTVFIEQIFKVRQTPTPFGFPFSGDPFREFYGYCRHSSEGCQSARHEDGQ